MNRQFYPGLFFALSASVLADTVTLHPLRPPDLPEFTLPLTLNNQSHIVAMQFDLIYPSAQVVPRLAGLSGSSDHAVASRDLGGRQRVVVSSPTNAELPVDFELELPLGATPASPNGGPWLEVTNLILATSSGASVPAQISRPRVEAWRRAHFTAAELLDPTLIGDDRDPDGDGVPNLMEFAGGTNPRMADDTQPVPNLISDAGGQALTLTWQELKNLTEVTITGQTSTTLTEWTVQGVTVVPTGNETPSTLELQARVQAGPESSRFLRLQFRRSQP